MGDVPPEITRLRDGIPTPGLDDAWVRLSDAETAVQDALARQGAWIVEELRAMSDESRYYHDAGVCVMDDELPVAEPVRAVAAEVA